MKTLDSIHKVLDKVISFIMIFLFIVMVVVGSYQIITRYFFNSPSTVSEELLTYTFTWMALFAAAYVFGKRDHMRMSFMADKIVGKKRMVLEVAIECLIIVFAGVVMIYGGVSIVKLTMTQITASLGIHMGYVYLVVPVVGTCMVIYSIINIARLLKQGENVGKEVEG
ncbi:MAG: TRAP transporter small permease [Lachnospiraceae bacterium]|jgi:TRAP-type C4-dicarboxylate transport system permease small subunit|nr:TRAP transporter small permease [Lachnospiraceae bacterium]MDD3616949.1 TRAP transporter small permease [Lachnospiraceae bacterium]